MYRYQNLGRYWYSIIGRYRYLYKADTWPILIPILSIKIMKLLFLLFSGLNRCPLQLLSDGNVTPCSNASCWIISSAQMTESSIIWNIVRYFSKKYRSKYRLFETDTDSDTQKGWYWPIPIHRYITISYDIYVIGFGNVRYYLQRKRLHRVSHAPYQHADLIMCP